MKAKQNKTYEQLVTILLLPVWKWMLIEIPNVTSTSKAGQQLCLWMEKYNIETQMDFKMVAMITRTNQIKLMALHQKQVLTKLWN
jgi:hypothetical protein